MSTSGGDGADPFTTQEEEMPKQEVPQVSSPQPASPTGALQDTSELGEHGNVREGKQGTGETDEGRGQEKDRDPHLSNQNSLDTQFNKIAIQRFIRTKPSSVTTGIL